MTYTQHYDSPLGGILLAFFCHTGSSQFNFVLFCCFEYVDGRGGGICFYHPIIVKEIIKNTR